jgi:serine protease Do
VTPDIANAMNLPKPAGALVASVSKGGPADKAGIRPGDVITQFEGTAIDTARTLSRTVAQASPGQQVSLTLLRESRPVSITAKLEKLEPSQMAEAGNGEEGPDGGPLGMTVAPLTDAARQRFQIRDGVDGAVVVAVSPRSEAAQRGIRPGDIISRVGATAVRSPQDLEAALKAAKENDRKTVLLLVQRQQGALFVPLPLNGAG